MPYKQGHKRLNYLCKGCNTEVYEEWQDINGGFWKPEHHTTVECVIVLNKQMNKLEDLQTKVVQLIETQQKSISNLAEASKNLNEAVVQLKIIYCK